VVYNGNDYSLFAAQQTLATFNYLWNSKFLRWIVKAVLSLTQDVNERHIARSIVSVELYAALLNNIVVPCLMVAVVDPHCFFNFLVAAPPVTASSVYQACVNFVVQGTTTTSCGGHTTLGLTVCGVQKTRPHNPHGRQSARYTCFGDCLSSDGLDITIVVVNIGFLLGYEKQLCIRQLNTQ
jgi:hypothetical protein